MAASTSKILRALGHNTKMLDAFCELVAAEKPNRELINWVVEHAKNDAALPINDANLTAFRQGYFSRWQKRRDTLDRIREQTAAAQRLVRESKEGGQSLPQAVALQATAVVAEALESFEPEQLKALLATDPKKFFPLVESIKSLSHADLGYQEYKTRVQFTKMKVKDKLKELEKAIKANPYDDKHSQAIQVLLKEIDAL
ncbi:MAG: hypothetical protein LBV12_06435 [Puniceicoccales bacterium]|jgi:hypothetical protein|nr:hypothetical protein [Puniceicoccales bacterium]